MSISIDQVQVVLRRAISPSKKPTDSQITDIVNMTYDVDARKEIQRMIDRRLNNPDTYGPYETYNTLNLMQRCLSTASNEFVSVYTNQAHLVKALMHYKPTSPDAEMADPIRDQARSVYKLLVDPSQLAEKRRVVLAERASKVAPPPTQARTVPLPTPPSSPKSPRTAHFPKGSFLPTPNPTPPRGFSTLGINDNFRDIISDVPTASIFDLNKEDVAEMTFKSEELDNILRVLDNRFKVGPSLRQNPDELVKALTLVHHCLYWGSDPFLTHCLDTKATFNNLRQHSVALVRSRSQAVVSLLDDSRRLKQERQSRITLMPRATTSSVIPQEQPTNKPVRENPRGAPKKSNTGPGPVREPVPDISKYVTKIGSKPVGGGGFSNVWEGEYLRDSGEKERVAIKFLRQLTKIPAERLNKRLNRELHMWRNLDHKNIAPFYGVTLDADGEPAMVSPFYTKGNLLEYVKNNQEIDPLKMLQGIAEGVEYLHMQNIVHGDIKGANIMISDGGRPKLIDFGLAQVVVEFAEVTGYTTSNLGSSLRWSAPELLINESDVTKKTPMSDVYAVASTCIEIMTLQPPYHGKKETQVMYCVVKQGGFPDRPSMEVRWSPCDELWEFLKTCWSTEPRDRPTISVVKRKLAEFYNGSTISPRRGRSAASGRV